jgi:hypothetical protein
MYPVTHPRWQPPVQLWCTQALHQLLRWGAGGGGGRVGEGRGGVLAGRGGGDKVVNFQKVRRFDRIQQNKERRWCKLAMW